MGMAASQARLLSITARLTNNENSGQSISYSKQRLADQTQQITNEYNEALNTTKLTVLTGFNGSDATYTDISYDTMTNKQMAANTKQYVVTDTKGRILVTEDIANAYKQSAGNYNQFLAKLGYSQSDMTVQNVASLSATDKQDAAQKIHEAWDKYFASVGIECSDDEHKGIYDDGTYRFKWNNVLDTNDKGEYLDKDGKVITADEAKTKGYSSVGSGYASWAVLGDDGKPTGEYNPINYEGTTDESRELYDYAMAITEAFMRTDESLTADQKNNNQSFDPSSYQLALDAGNKADLNYYKNIFSKMQSSGYFTYTNTPATAKDDPEHYKYASVGTGTAGNVQKSPLKDNTVFEAALRDGSLRLEYYSTTSKSFKTTTISEDNCIQEVSDERAIARAESKYNQDMADLENQDKKLDLELKKLDTEHSALQTEYDSVKNVVDKNVESSFKTFG
ncbi:hypothetical protein BHV42_04400 [Candidatus Melainabacteria bacterium MEL.A1]|jgi:hypothetical protein|nr:hypothetical protein BHV42_04400 [Candidatus Melainabacteria bacterium MEL.A1]